MVKVALKGLLGRRLRAGLTAIAIVLGVAMVSGTYVLTDTIKSAFNTVFTTVYRHSDAVITGRSAIGSAARAGQIPSFPESLLARVRALPGVAAASGGIQDSAGVVGRDGKIISRGGAPGLAFSYNPAGRRFNPLTLISGNWPSRPDEVDIDATTAANNGYRVGQTITVAPRGPEVHARIVGTVQIAGVSSLGGASMVIFTLPEAQRVFGKQGRLDQINVAARPGTTPGQLVREIRPLLPPSAQVRTGQAQARHDSSDTNDFLSIFQDFLLAFGGIALFVGSFVIANTLSITIAQRTRELATLRTLGATRRQILRSVLLEALVIGVLASLVGLFAGLGLAKGLNSLLVSFGIDLPHASTVFAARTVIVALLVGIIITVLAALRPALRSTHVPPIAAVREGAILPRSRFARFGSYPAAGTIALAVALLLVGLLVSAMSTGTRLLAIGLGAALVFIGVAMLAPKLVPPLSAWLGWPATRIGGGAGRLARRNVVRDPSRTASTASALMIGLALVTLVAVLAAGLRSRFEDAVNQQFRADYALTSSDTFTPLGVAASDALRPVAGVQVVAGVRAGDGRMFGHHVTLTGVPPDVHRVLALRWLHGGPQVPAELGSDGAFLDHKTAVGYHLHVGSPISVEVPSGARLHLVVRGIFDPPKGGSPLGAVTISNDRFDASFQSPENLYTLIRVAGGVSPANTRRLNAALRPFPDAKLQTESQFKASEERGINTLLNLLYVLLSLSIVISLFGIVNTLVLTVFERTRELGMLRAVGMTRRQVRRMIRHESVITALLGATLGIPVGIVLALIVGATIGYSAVAIPWGTLLVFVLAAILAGLIAAIMPARRAGRLNVLVALQYE